MKKKILMIISAMILLASITPSFVIAKSFNDVAESHWAYTYIDELSNANVISGYANNNFNPSNTITKAEYLKLLVSTIASESENKELQDSMGNYTEWFEAYLNYAKSNEIISEDYTIEELKENVSRKEMATLLVEFADYVGLVPAHEYSLDVDAEYDIVEAEEEELSDEEIIALYELDSNLDVTVVDDVDELEDDLELAEIDDEAVLGEDEEIEDVDDEDLEIYAPFVDVNELSAEEQFDIAYAVELGLVNGYDDGTFKPENKMTRAEVATIIYRFINCLEKAEIEEVAEPIAVEISK